MQIKEINLIKAKKSNSQPQDNQFHRLIMPQKLQIKEINLIELCNLIELKIKLMVISHLHAIIIKRMIKHLQTNNKN